MRQVHHDSAITVLWAYTFVQSRTQLCCGYTIWTVEQADVVASQSPGEGSVWGPTHEIHKSNLRHFRRLGHVDPLTQCPFHALKELPVAMRRNRLWTKSKFTIITDHRCHILPNNCCAIVSAQTTSESVACVKAATALAKPTIVQVYPLSLALRIFRTVEAFHLQLWSWKLLAFIVTGKNTSVLAI